MILDAHTHIWKKTSNVLFVGWWLTSHEHDIKMVLASSVCMSIWKRVPLRPTKEWRVPTLRSTRGWQGHIFEISEFGYTLSEFFTRNIWKKKSYKGNTYHLPADNTYASAILPAWHASRPSIELCNRIYASETFAVLQYFMTGLRFTTKLLLWFFCNKISVAKNKNKLLLQKKATRLVLQK